MASSVTDDESDTPDEVFVCAVSDLVGDRKKVKVADRDVVILKTRGRVYALDSFCYHAGGPLHQGDIEDFNGWTCLVCPWHKYKVCVDTGEMVYQSCDPHNMKKPPVWKSSGVKQRTHKVTVKDGNIYVQFTKCTGELQSDHYNCLEYREKMGLE